MLNALIRWSMINRLAVVVAFMLLTLIGGLVTWTMPVDVFPDLTAPTVTILVEGRGMAPEEMETLVTFPIEAAVNGAHQVRRVRSATAVGIAVIWVEFEWGADIYRARQVINERLNTVAGGLPPQVRPPVLAPVSSIMGEILFLSLTSDQHGPMVLHSVAAIEIRRRLLAVPGVSQVTPIGGEERQYQVVLSPSRLRAYGLGINEVADALRASNENVSAGILVAGGEESLVRGLGRVRTLDDLRDTVVAVRRNAPVRVGDLGVVRFGPAIKRGEGAASRRAADGTAITEHGVILAVQKQPDANTLELTRRLDAVLDTIQASLPDGMKINKDLFRQARFIETSVHNTVEALRDGGIMVVLIVLVFLVSFRASIITLLAIPISLVAAVLALRLFGASINTMTLGGMAIAVGMLVDDAIIDVENIVRRLRENAALAEVQRRPLLEVVYRASVEVRGAIVFATLIIILVFCPLFLLSGVEGRLLRPLGVAFVVSLGASLVVALTLTPALSYYLLPRSRTVRNPREPWVVRWCKRLYRAPLEFSLQRPRWVLVPTAVAFGLALLFGLRLGRNFLPEFNEGALVVGVMTLPGTSLQQSDELARVVQETLMEHPEIVAIGRRTGRAEQDEHVQGVEASEIDLTLDMKAPARLGLPTRTKAALLAALREDLAAVPGVQVTFGQPISHRIDHMLSGSRANVAVKVFGEDLQKLRDLARRIEALMAGVPGIVDLMVEQQVDVPALLVEFNRSAMARYGLRATDVAFSLEAALKGAVIGEVLEGRVPYDLVLRLGGSEYGATRAVDDVLIDTHVGARVPLRAVAHIYEDRGPNFISRENVQRKIVVTCNVAGRDVEGVVEAIRASIDAHLGLPPVYYIEYGGQFESAAAANRRLSMATVLVIVGIGFLLHVAFRSGRDAALILVNLPLALIGGVAGVYLSDGILSVASVIGFISVFGIAARNGIMLVSHIRHLQREEGVDDFHEAIRRGAMERLSPILMTALSAALALLPLALGRGEPGKEILHPMAMVILFGLLSATFLNMLVVPALYRTLGRPAEAVGSVE
jgi:CzcA family heavy metal efflux pump